MTTSTLNATCDGKPTVRAPAAISPAEIDPVAQRAALELTCSTDNTYRAWRIHQGVVYAASHRAETWLADVRLNTKPGPDGLLEAIGTPRIGAHAEWRVRVPNVTVLAKRLRELEHSVRASYAASARFRDQMGRQPFAGIDDLRLAALRKQTQGGTYELPF